MKQKKDERNNETLYL